MHHIHNTCKNIQIAKENVLVLQMVHVTAIWQKNTWDVTNVDISEKSFNSDLFQMKSWWRGWRARRVSSATPRTRRGEPTSVIQTCPCVWRSGRGPTQVREAVTNSAWKISIRRFVITEKAPTRAFSWLKAATTAFTFKTLLRHYAKRVLTPLSLNVKLGPQHKGHKGRAVWLA